MGNVNSGNLMKYITFVKNLEVSLYEQQKVLDSLNNGIVTTYSKKKLKKKTIHEPLLIMLFCGCWFCSFVSAFIAAIIAFFRNYRFGIIITSLFINDELFGPIWEAIKTGFFIGLPIGIPLGFIVWLSDYKRAGKENKEVDRYNAEADRDNRMNSQAINKKNELLSCEIKFVKNSMNKTKQILDNVYSMNIIHPKYRHNLIYICSIFEYFDTGRCNKLEGHEGAYNLLESDIKYHIILDQLDTIITKLDDIRDNQRELYTAVTNTNKNIQQVNSSINRLSGTMNNVQDSLNHIEYNSRISMQNGEYLKWYAYFRN